MENEIVVDFSYELRPINKNLYGSGMHIFVSDRHIIDETEVFKNLRFHTVRNHDWALNNSGQRMIDTHFIFPLMHLDPSEERNYYFGPSDEVIRLVYEAGSKVFYRLGTSIEHTEGIHFNANPPEDYAKYAEVCAGIVRHYTRGWNNGFHYDMQYWEIWNEPDGHITMWTGSDEEFAKFFAIVLKRLKSEFPELKFGGPAHCEFNRGLIWMLKAECDKLGVKPDFYSYHIYGNSLQGLEGVETGPRAFFKEIGWGDVEICINEWHFIRSWSGVHSNVTEESYKRYMESDDGLMGINSAAYNIAALCIWQNAGLDSAFYYGCGRGSWGMRYPSRRFNKNYYSLLLMRDMVYDFPRQAFVSGGTECQRVLAGVSEDGKGAALLITDFCGPDMEIPVKLTGDNFKAIECTLLDSSCDNAPVACEMQPNGTILLRKNQPGSAVFFLRFQR